MAFIPRPKAGDLITEGLLNRLVDQFERFASIRSGSPYVLISDGPDGKHLALDLPVPTWALLSGSTSPYSWTEVYEGPSGTWPAMPSGDSGTAYESNGKSGLAGKVVPITWTAAGDWRFVYLGYAPPTVSWKFRINGCTTATGVPGATIELYQSAVLIDSCTTADGTGGTTAGECTMTVPTGSYDVVVTGPSGKGFANQSFTASASGTTTTRILAADSNHICAGSVCNYPIPKVLFTTDSLGAHTLTWDGGKWAGTATQSANTRLGVSLGGPCPTSGSATVTIELDSSLSGITYRWKGICCELTPFPALTFEYYYAADGSSGGTTQNVTATGSRTSFTCDPISFTFNGLGLGSGYSCLGGAMYGVVTPGGTGVSRSQAVTP